ncbi:MAG TPA: hypothetical protein VG960_12180, partial [Caulobacteraceae bacterium]|nr:hypothetical protein [Caulobacteraceae bacterium]
MTAEAQLAVHTAAEFAGPMAKECDLVMKGGVTSGLVYPYAILQLAQDYRLRSIGGTSAGAIAAAFAAAAEYGRQTGDPAAFVRLQSRCLELPQLLEGLFQPSRPLAPVMCALKAWSRTKHWSRWIGAALVFWPSLATGAIAGALVMAAVAAGLGGVSPTAARAALPGVVVGTALGSVIALGLRVWRLVFKLLPAHHFGLCSGM